LNEKQHVALVTVKAFSLLVKKFTQRRRPMLKPSSGANLEML